MRFLFHTNHFEMYLISILTFKGFSRCEILYHHVFMDRMGLLGFLTICFM